MLKPVVYTCECCELPHQAAEHRDTPRRCPPCATHYYLLGEDPTRTTARLEAHDAELRRRIGVMVQAQRLADAKIARLHDQLDHDAVARAYESRDRWRSALTFVVEQHDLNSGGRCVCGAAWPCLTLTSLERFNKGIARQVEEDIVSRQRRDALLDEIDNVG